MVKSFTPLFTVTVVFAMLVPITAEAQSLADRDAKEVADYVQTDAALAKYTKAVHKLQPLMGE